MIQETKGDIIEMAKQGWFDVLVHGCNCFCTMGAGLAKRIKEEFPDAYYVDKGTIRGDRSKLGQISLAVMEHLIIGNAYIQYRYGGSGVHCDYRAVQDVMDRLHESFPDNRIGMPKIGAGLAGGDWKIIRGIIYKTLNDCDVTIVHYDK